LNSPEARPRICIQANSPAIRNTIYSFMVKHYLCKEINIEIWICIIFEYPNNIVYNIKIVQDNFLTNLLNVYNKRAKIIFRKVIGGNTFFA
jgi:hypothetical protein